MSLLTALRPSRVAASPRAAGAFPSSVRARSLMETAMLAVAGLGLGAVIAVQLETRTALGGPGALLTELGRWTGLVATYGALLIVVLVARVPWVERAVGLGGLMRWHRVLGPVVLVGLAAHAVLTTLGYAADSGISFLGQTWTFVTTYPWMLPAVVGLVLMIVGGLTSWRVARRRMAYETWWVTHLYFYLAIALAYLHQVMYGQQFATHAWARWFWIGLYVVTVGTVLVFRVGRPLWSSFSLGLRVHAVERESSDTVSVWISGRGVDRLRVRGGQYFGFRFLTRDGWWQSHPYSVSAGSDPTYLRITVKDLGDHSRSLAALRPGTRVVVEGPYGVFTADDRRTGHVVLVAGGVGVAPVRALVDDLPHDVEIDLLYRVPRAEALVLRHELESLAAARAGRMRLRYLVGSRVHYPITPVTLQHLVPDIAGADVYCCGPQDLVDTVARAARTLGLPAERIHDEAFSFHSPDHYSFGGSR